MKIGIRLHDTIHASLRDMLYYTHDQGFSCAHLALSKTLPDFAMADAPKLLTKELAASVRDDFAAADMSCAVLGCYLSLADPDEESQKKTQEIYHAHLRFARMIGAGVVGTETPCRVQGLWDKDAPDSEDALNFFIDCVRPVVNWAEEEDALLAIEPVWCHIVSTPERAERMLDALHSDHVRIILDGVNLLSPAAVPNADAVMEDAIRRLGDRVNVLHMKDFVNGDPGNCVACGLGEMRYERLLRFAKENDLPMTLENTKPENAREARVYLENIAKDL